MTSSVPTLALGHGTANDFVLFADPEAVLDPSPARVAALCHRRTGLGGDGLLRAVPTAACPEVADQAAEAQWFMDYRNGDGSVAEMCGNGLRVFARYLVRQGLITPGTHHIATRGGVREVQVADHGDVTVGMGMAAVPRLRAMPVVTIAEGRSWSATPVFVPNPHAVTFVDSVADAGALLTAPSVAPADVFPDGVNVEFVVVHAPNHVSMRVHERGVGETQSCGTGAVAVAWATRRQFDTTDATIRVDVPGGTVQVTEHADGTLDLIGPAVIVADVSPDPAWWAALPR